MLLDQTEEKAIDTFFRYSSHMAQIIEVLATEPEPEPTLNRLSWRARSW